MRVALALALATTLAACAGGAGDAGEDGAAGNVVDPGYSATDARVVETGPDGEPRYTLRAAVIRQDPRSLEIRLEQPTMQLRQDAEAPWTLSADAGLMPENASSIDLLGGVEVAGTLGGQRGRGGEPVVIRSESLRYEFAPALVTSDAEVSIRLSGKWLGARGLEANLKQRKVRLESDVHGLFAR